MEVVIIEKQKMEELLTQLRLMNANINEKKIDTQLIDNADLLQLMKISKRTAANWRAKKRIAYSIIGNKVYYKLKDVEETINKRYVKAFMSKASIE